MKSCKSGLLEVLLKKSIFKSLKYSKKNIRHRERDRERERERERVKWSSTHDFTKLTLCNFKKKTIFSKTDTFDGVVSQDSKWCNYVCGGGLVFSSL